MYLVHEEPVPGLNDKQTKKKRPQPRRSRHILNLLQCYNLIGVTPSIYQEHYSVIKRLLCVNSWGWTASILSTKSNYTIADSFAFVCSHLDKLLGSK